MSTVAPGSQSSLREANSARIVDTIRHYGQITQVELAAATGLSPATVSNIVKQLTSAGLLKTDTTIRSGRRAQLVSLATSNGLAVGIEVGRRHLRIEIADESHEVTTHRYMPLPHDHRVDTTLDRAALLVMDLTEGLGSSLDDVLAVAVTLPAPVDPKTGDIALRSMPGWDEFNIGQVLSARLNRTVIVENDANAGAVGESRFGALRGVDNGFYVHVSHSVGAGIIADGKVLHGVRGLAGEIGHVQVNPAGLVCRCGARGCLETVVSADALLALLRLQGNIHSMSDLISAAKRGDPGCRQVVADAASTIGTVIADLAISLAPEHIVLGGALGLMDDLFLGPVQEALARRPHLPQDLTVATSTLDGRAEVLGALALARDAAQLAPASSMTSPHGELR